MNKSLTPKTTLAKREIQITWSFQSLFKILLFGLLCYSLYLLLPFIMLLFLSLLLTVTLEPFAKFLSRSGNRSLAVFLIGLMGLSLVVFIGIMVMPELISQISAIYIGSPEIIDSISKEVPALAPVMKRLSQKIQSIDTSEIAPLLSHVASAGGVAIGALSSLVLVFAFSIYLLLDGSRIFSWLIAFFKESNQVKVVETCKGVNPVIRAYVMGQVITSTLCAIFTYIILLCFGVPAALVLAVLAAVFDVLPIVGFFLFTVPAALLALTVSPTVAFWVVFSFGAYHMLETYVILPTVYGNRMRVSGIVVLLSLIIGATLGGVVGAISILPLVASYPIFEKVWLSKILGRRVLREHERASKNSDQVS